jgi:hypothetical protein
LGVVSATTWWETHDVISLALRSLTNITYDVSTLISPCNLMLAMRKMGEAYKWSLIAKH